jgi:antirestriction protein ArdC
MEELVAELASAFLCADLNLTPQIREDHAAYIANWLEVLKNVCSGKGNNCVNAFVLDAAETAQ